MLHFVPSSIFFATSLQVFKNIDKITTKPPLHKAEQSWISQPLLTGEVLQSLQSFLWPDSFHVSHVLWGPELDAGVVSPMLRKVGNVLIMHKIYHKTLHTAIFCSILELGGGRGGDDIFRREILIATNFSYV